METARTSRLAIDPATPTIGAFVSGVDLRDLDDAMAQDLRRALLDHLVLFFHGQEITDADQLALGRHFGGIQVSRYGVVDPDAPEVNVLDSIGAGIGSSPWHADHTFLAEPPLGSILRSVRLPETGGGDTCFASMYAAYDALAEPMRDMLDGLTAQHVHPNMPLAIADGAPVATDPVVHPVIATHRETGRKLLNVNSAWTTRILELSEAESDAVLRALFEHVKVPEFHCRFRWQEGSIAFWDNRAVQHYAVQDYHGRRIMRRVMVTDVAPTA